MASAHVRRARWSGGPSASGGLFGRRNHVSASARRGGSGAEAPGGRCRRSPSGDRIVQHGGPTPPGSPAQDGDAPWPWAASTGYPPQAPGTGRGRVDGASSEWELHRDHGGDPLLDQRLGRAGEGADSEVRAPSHELSTTSRMESWSRPSSPESAAIGVARRASSLQNRTLS